MRKKSTSINLSVMQVSAAKACALLKVLANPDRLLLMCQLSQGELCVSDLEEQLGIRQPTLSQQLGVLRDNALVETRREGKSIFASFKFRVGNVGGSRAGVSPAQRTLEAP
ncbi:ArsR/SmtB family transcription factor [Paraburkholderia xenovorans]